MINFIYTLLGSLGYHHPLHPVLVHLPIGLTMGALVLSLAARILHKPELHRSAYHALILTAIFSVAALFVGFMDWRHYFNGAWLRPIAIKIFIAIPFTCLMLLGIGIGYLKGPQSKALLPIYMLGFFSVMSLGYFGGELTFSARSPIAISILSAGQNLFEANCGSCHAFGGNSLVPSKPLHSSPQLASLDKFKAHVRNPTLAGGAQAMMPAFSEKKLSDADLEKLYVYIQRYIVQPQCATSQIP
ncbi:MAG: c-type cytochrome [Methylococcaceae bacterium]|nr:c-type cytochrome [Methylococcaceae bacterium]